MFFDNGLTIPSKYARMFRLQLATQRGIAMDYQHEARYRRMLLADLLSGKHRYVSYHFIALNGQLHAVQLADVKAYIALYPQTRQQVKDTEPLPLEVWYVPMSDEADPVIFEPARQIQNYGLEIDSTQGITLLTLPNQGLEASMYCEAFLDDLTARLALKRLKGHYLPLAFVLFLKSGDVMFYYPAELPASRLLRIIKQQAINMG